MKITNDFSNHYSVTTDMLADYLTGESWDYLLLFADGTWDVRAAGERYTHETCVAMAKCPGLNYLRLSDFADYHNEQDQDQDWNTAIREFCRHGKTIQYIEHLNASLAVSYIEMMENSTSHA